ncbi:MAG: S1 RNA-binding domain-containing protein [Oscillospiraceae bacterium]|nr:S1 RNA-binding domain-containing protein [Oscillospiraceae bacterium]
MEKRIILEGTAVMCDTAHNLTVQVGEFTGIIPREEAALGIESGKTRDIAILSRVGKPVCFVVCGMDSLEGRPLLHLSRKAAQERALAHLMRTLTPGDIIPARVTHLEPFGAFVDIGCGNIALAGIENLSVSRISHPKDRMAVGQEIFAVVRAIDRAAARVTLTHRELLGTWQENAARFEAGQTVRGVVRGVEEYGIFVELAPNLSGLAEKKEGVGEGDAVSVFIKSIVPERMKIKLVVIDVFGQGGLSPVTRSDYFLTEGHLDVWEYSPSVCEHKRIFTDFKQIPDLEAVGLRDQSLERGIFRP